LRVRLFKPNVRERAIDYVSEVLRTGWLGMGPKTEEFERVFSECVNSRHCVAVNSGTSALHLAIKVLNLPPGSEVITTPVTFVSTNHVLLYEDLKPVFADIEPDTGNIDFQSVASRITEKTGAIMIMHYGGYPCSLDDFYGLGRNFNIPVIEDCAHACGAEYAGRKIGSHDSLQAFSFDPTKNLTAGSGGALTFSDAECEKRLRQLRYLGIDKDPHRRKDAGGNGYTHQYSVEEVGFRYHMNDVTAAIGLAQIEYLTEDNNRREEIVDQYSESLCGIAGVELLRRENDRRSSNFLFAVLVESRDRLIEKLRRNDVESAVHFSRCDRYKMYEEQNLPCAQYFCDRVISLPMHTSLTDDEIDFVIKIIRGGW